MTSSNSLSLPHAVRSCSFGCSLLLSLVACVPLGGVGAVGARCDDGPCAIGLLCVEGVCTAPEATPPPECSIDDDCAVDGDAGGRVCTDGSCAFATCAFDIQCGGRICVDGSCAIAVACDDDDTCKSNEVCTNGACRAACASDDECPSIAGFGLATCVEGRCQQRCLNDATCLGGGICDAGSCRTPDCDVDDDCSAQGDFRCDTGRCVAFTRCASSPDCFDPNFFCDASFQPGRCTELPTCLTDAACGASSLCLDRHCRDATACDDDTACAGDEECLAQRCVAVPACRSDDACNDGFACVNLRCTAAPAPQDAALVVVADDSGVCNAGSGSCTRVLFGDEPLHVRVQAYDAQGLPIRASIPVASEGVDVVPDDAGADAANAGFTLRATRADGFVRFGATQLSITSILPVDDAATPAITLRVLVIDEDGTSVADAQVQAGDALEVLTDARGVAEFAGPVSTSTSAALVVRAGDRGIAVDLGVDAFTGDLRVMLPPRATTLASAAPLAVGIEGSGDEAGEVGVGLALPSVRSAHDASLRAMLGDVVNAGVTLPVLGTLPLPVVDGLVLKATLPLVGAQDVHPTAHAVVHPGPAFVLAFEDRRVQNDLVALALGGDPIGSALDLAATAEGMDALLLPVQNQTARPLVADSGDRDGDGDASELVPDFAAADEAPLLARPSHAPQERIGVVVGPPPSSAQERAIAVAGLDLAGLFVPTGLTVVRGDVDGADRGEQLRAVAPDAALSGAARAVAVHAIFDDAALSSHVVVRARAFGPRLEAGRMLAPPTGAFVLSDVPTPGDRLVVCPFTPGGSALRVRLVDGNGTSWHVIAAVGPGDGSVLLPRAIPTDAVLVGVDVLRLPGTDSLGATRAPFRAGRGPLALDEIAEAIARAPAGG